MPHKIVVGLKAAPGYCLGKFSTRTLEIACEPPKQPEQPEPRVQFSSQDVGEGSNRARSSS